MATGVLGQSAPGATTLTDVYTVPSGQKATIRIVVANRGSAGSFRVAISPNGDVIANAHYIAYDQAIEANASVTSAPMLVGDDDVVRVYGSSANMSFSVTGIEEAE